MLGLGRRCPLPLRLLCTRRGSSTSASGGAATVRVGGLGGIELPFRDTWFAFYQPERGGTAYLYEHSAPIDAVNFEAEVREAGRCRGGDGQAVGLTPVLQTGSGFHAGIGLRRETYLLTRCMATRQSAMGLRAAGLAHAEERAGPAAVRVRHHGHARRELCQLRRGAPPVVQLQPPACRPQVRHAVLCVQR